MPLGMSLALPLGNSLGRVIDNTLQHIFNDGSDGALYEIWDLSTLKQERTGASATTPSGVGDVVGTVLDVSGNGNHLTAPSDAARPILRQSGSLYYLEFDGVDDLLEASISGLSSTSAFVTALDPGADGQYIIHAGQGLSRYMLAAANGSGDVNLSSPTITSGSIRIDAVTYSESDRDDLHDSLTGAPTVVTVGEVNLSAYTEFGVSNYEGAGWEFDGNWYGTLLIDRALTSSERTSVEALFANKASVTLPSIIDLTTLFDGGEDGGYYDLAITSSLKQERTGASATTAVEVGDVIGTILDQSGNANHLTAPSDAARPILGVTLDETWSGLDSLMAGESELVENGDFSSTTVSSNWNIYTDPGDAALTVIDGECHFTGSGTHNVEYPLTGLTPGQYYRVRYRLSTAGANATAAGIYGAASGGSLILATNASADDNLYTYYFKATAATNYLVFRRNGASTVVFDDVSVKEVPLTAPHYYYAEFDGVDDQLEVTFASTLAQPNTIVLAAKYDDTPASSTYMVDGIDASNRNRILQSAGNTFRVAANTAIDVSGVDTDNHVLTFFANGTESINGVDGAYTTGDAGTQGVAGLKVGCRHDDASFVEGKVYALVFAGDALTPVERRSAELTLAPKANVTLS